MAWIDNYVTYAKNNECPTEFHWWTGMNMLGAVMRNRVFVKRGYWVTYPNLWVLIIAPSGVKKTTAAQIGVNLLSKFDHVNILAERMTPEALASNLGAEDPEAEPESQALIYAPELSSFLDKRQHNEGLVQFLLRLADCPLTMVHKTKSSGNTYLRNVAVSFLGCTTEGSLRKAVPSLALEDGFLARFISVTAPDAPIKCVPFPVADPEGEMAVMRELYDISLLEGETQWPKAPWDWFYQWYTYHKTKIVPKAAPNLAAWHQRKPEHLIRLAIGTSLSQDKRNVLTIDGFEEAEEHLNKIESYLSLVYSSLEATEAGIDTHNILAQIKKAGGQIKHTDLLRKNISKMNATQLRQHMQSLLEAGEIRCSKSDTRGILYELAN